MYSINIATRVGGVDLRTQSGDAGDVGGAGEVRATGASFRATCGATLTTLHHCLDLLRRRERQARQAEDLYM